MTAGKLTGEVLEATPRGVPRRIVHIAGALMGVGLLGIVLGFLTGAGWVALHVSTCLVIGLAVGGVVVSAIFQLTGARWGRAYRRLAEASAVLMPVGLVGILVLLAGAGGYVPWTHDGHLTGGKHVWLVRGFWDLRVLGALAASWGLAIWFLYHSLRKDFCTAGISERFRSRLGRFLGRGIDDPEREAARCDARMTTIAPALLIVYGFAFTMLAIDLIMSLEPDWFSTLFGGWYFISLLFAGLALLAILTVGFRRYLGLGRFLTARRQQDLATLLFAFCLLTTDFFWSQYLTIWYGNLPEETVWVITRTLDASQPFAGLSWITLAALFVIPFVALLFRRIKRSGPLLVTVASVVIVGVLLARFLEIAPALIDVEPGSGPSAALLPLLSSAMVFGGLMGAGLLLLFYFLTWVPVMPVGDRIFVREFSDGEEGS